MQAKKCIKDQFFSPRLLYRRFLYNFTSLASKSETTHKKTDEKIIRLEHVHPLFYSHSTTMPAQYLIHICIIHVDEACIVQMLSSFSILCADNFFYCFVNKIIYISSCYFIFSHNNKVFLCALLICFWSCWSHKQTVASEVTTSCCMKSGLNFLDPFLSIVFQSLFFAITTYKLKWINNERLANDRMNDCFRLFQWLRQHREVLSGILWFL